MDDQTLNKLHDIAAMISIARELADGQSDLIPLLDGAGQQLRDILDGYHPVIETGTPQ